MIARLRILLCMLFVVSLCAHLSRSVAAESDFQGTCTLTQDLSTACRSFSSSGAYYGSVKFECSVFDSAEAASAQHAREVDRWARTTDAELVELSFYYGEEGAGIRSRQDGGILGVLIFRIGGNSCVWSYLGGVDPFYFGTFEDTYLRAVGAEYSAALEFSGGPMDLIPSANEAPFDMAMTSEIGYNGIISRIETPEEVQEEPQSPSPTPTRSSGPSLQLFSISSKDAGLGNGTRYVYVEIKNNSSQLHEYVGVEAVCRDRNGTVVGTAFGSTANVRPGELAVITMVMSDVSTCTSISARFDSSTNDQ